MNESMTRRGMLQATARVAVATGAAVNAPVLGSRDEQDRERTPQRAGSQNPRWYLRHLVGIEWGPTGANDKDKIYLSRATGKQIIDHQLKAHSEYAVLFMKDMEFAYYNSRVARKCPNLARRDLLRECLDEAQKHNMPVVAYCQVQYDHSSWKAHPEWRMKDPNGNDIPSRLCYHSGYLDFIKRVTGEMMEYEISGFHIDMLDFGFGPPYGCWCKRCQAAFRKEHGIAMPKGVTWDQAWEKMLAFRCQSNTRFCKELQSFIKATRPDISVDFNYHGYPPFSWEVGQRPVLHAINGDFVTAEGLPFIFGHANPSLLTCFLKGARPGGPVQVATSRTMHGYHDFNVRPLAELKWEVFTYLAHGAQCTVVDKANYDGTLDRVAYERLGEVFGEAIAKREYFGHKPLQEVGLYYSSRSRDWYGREDPVKYMAAFWGAHKALMESHITMGMVMDENASLERLRTFPVVYVPSAPVLTQEEVQLFDAYVSGGGSLLVTGLTGVCDRYGRVQTESLLSGIIGARLTRCELEHSDNYLRLPGELAKGDGAFLLEGIPSDWPMLVWGPLATYESAGARALGELMLAYRSKDNQWSNHMSPASVTGPALLVHRRGKGRVLCVPCALDAAYVGDFRMPEHRRLIRNLIRHMNPHPEIAVHAPPNVEIVITHDQAGRRLLVHLLAFSGSVPSAAVPFPKGTRVLPPLMAEPMDYKARVQVNRPFRRVEVAGPGTDIVVKKKGMHLQTCNPHEVLIVHV